MEDEWRMIVECVERVEPGPPRLTSIAAAAVEAQVRSSLVEGTH